MASPEVFPVVVVMVACASACSAQHMQVPPEIASRSDVLDVTDRSSWSGALVNESFELGPYAISDVDRKWDSSSGFSIGSVSHETSEGGYAYALEGGGPKQVGHCMTGKRDTGIGLGNGLGLEFQFSKLACQCEAGGKQATVTVESRDGTYAGAVTTSGGTYQIKSVHELEGGGSTGKPSGYRMDGDRAVGAAEVTHPGRVWLDKALETNERREVACLFAGLMLYKPKDSE